MVSNPVPSSPLCHFQGAVDLFPINAVKGHAINFIFSPYLPKHNISQIKFHLLFLHPFQLLIHISVNALTAFNFGVRCKITNLWIWCNYLNIRIVMKIMLAQTQKVNDQAHRHWMKSVFCDVHTSLTQSRWPRGAHECADKTPTCLLYGYTKAYT